MIIGIIGSNGFIGKNLVKNLEKEHSITKIIRDNAIQMKSKKYDVLINAAGQSKRYLATNDPLTDFKESVLSTYWYLTNYSYNKYIHISTIDVNKDNRYGRHRKLLEEIICYHIQQPYRIILRCAAVIGDGMKKGLLKDILCDQPIRSHPTSKTQFITINEILKTIKKLLNKEISGNYINLCGYGGLTPEEIGKLIGKQINFSEDLNKPEIYNEKPTSFLTLKTSKEYIMEEINERME